MARIWPVAISLALVFPLRLLAADPNPPLHEPAIPPGTHPRLILTGSAEVEAARAKVNTPNTLSGYLFQNTLSNTYKTNLNPPFYAPGLYEILYASQPILALLDPSAASRQEWARSAINTSLHLIATYDAPYPDSPEWYGRFAYRYIALTYDACYDQMTPAERATFQDEMKSIASSLSAGGFEDSPGNHGIAAAVGLALTAIALDGDIDTDTQTITEALVRQTSSPQADFPRFRYPINVLCVSSTPQPTCGSPDYVNGVHYTWGWTDMGGFNKGHGIRWLTSSPTLGSTYYVTYTWKPDVQRWRDRARLALQRNLDHLWGEGASTAGVMYGSWTTAWMVDAFEAIRRSNGYDFGLHPSVRNAVSWYASELIANAPGVTNYARVHNRNDSSYSSLFRTTAPGTGTYLTWMLQRFKDDPGGLDDAAYWLLSRDTRWTTTARWREALWVNDAMSGPPPFTPPSPLGLPLSKFFGAVNLGNYRTGSWDGPPADWSLLTVSAHPWIGGEHFQVDEGAFSFYALGTDFAIDTGYAFVPNNPPIDPVMNNSSEGHNLVLFPYSTYGNGTCTGYTSTWQDVTGSALLRSQLTSGLADAAHVDLKRTYLPLSALPGVGDPPCWPVASADRFALLLKRPGRAPYAIVADSIAVNASSRTYQFGMHTAPGNAVAINGNKATITRSATAATLDAYATASAAVTWSSSTWPYVSDGEVQSHPRLLASASAVDPRFLVVLVPEKIGEPSPLAVTVDDPAGGNRAVVTVAGGGLTDVILRNETSGLAVSGGGLESDAALAVVRTNGSGTVVGWTVEDGTYLKQNGVDLWRVLAPAAARGSAVYDGASVSAVADDATELRAFAPGCSSFKAGSFTHLAVVEGSQIHWRGTRRLLDVEPQGVPAFADDFSSSVAPHWVTPPRSLYARVVAGEFCDQGRSGQTNYVSHTNRVYDPSRADLLQAPRSIYGDAVWKGEFTVQSLPSVPSGAKVVLKARVADRSFPAFPAVDQDSVKLEIDVASGTGILTGRLAGVTTTLWSGSVGTIGSDLSHPYTFTLDGLALSFTLDGQQRFSLTAPAGSIPQSGYFQWEDMPSLHVHYDDVVVELLGRTLDACATNADCDDGLYCTQDLCNTSTHACAHPPISCPSSEPHCFTGGCDEENDQCVQVPITPDPPPWRCGRVWCYCG